jgi:predicted phage terminase large subunit-like protein
MKTRYQDPNDILASEAIQAARDDLLAFCMLMEENFIVAPHIRLMADKLMEVYRGEIKRLMIFMPPRSGKSHMTSVYAPAWFLGHIPSWQIIGISHSSTLIEDFSREVRNLVSSDMYQLIFPGVTLRSDSRAANRWHTNHAGIYTAIGTGGKIAGRGANCAFIDDPISEQDAYSKLKRQSVNNWYPGGLRSRLMPNGRVILTMTRWNEDDLAGSLLKRAQNNEDTDQWDVVKFPAFLSEEEAMMLEEAREKCIAQGLLPPEYPHMKAERTYWPVLPEYQKRDTGLRGWSTEELSTTKANTPPHEWEALYMQRPTAEEGNIIKRRWWRMYEKDDPPRCDYVLMSMDTAYSERETADYSAITTWGIFRDENEVANLILLGAQKGRWDFPTLRRKTFDLYNYHEPDAILIEKKASGQSLIQDLRASGVPVLEYQPDKDKVARAYASTPLFHGGRIWAPTEIGWAEDVMFECSVFPASDYDDYVDTVTQAVIWVKDGSWVVHPDDEWQHKHEYGRMNNTKRQYYNV